MNEKNVINVKKLEQLRNAAQMAMEHIVQKRGNIETIESLSRYVTFVYEMEPIDSQHYEEFVAQYLLQNMSSLIQDGWMDDVHTICNDTSTNCDINMEMI